MLRLRLLLLRLLLLRARGATDQAPVAPRVFQRVFQAPLLGVGFRGAHHVVVDPHHIWIQLHPLPVLAVYLLPRHPRPAGLQARVAPRVGQGVFEALPRFLVGSRDHLFLVDALDVPQRHTILVPQAVDALPQTPAVCWRL